MREIKINELESYFQFIIAKLKNENISRIQINNDLYNKIPTHDWDIINNPDDVTVIGSLFDDIDSLQKVISEPDRPFTYVDFDRVASLLRIISEIQNPVN